MNIYHRFTFIFWGLFFSCSATFGQEPAGDHVTREMLRQALEEKMGGPAKEKDNYKLGRRTTGGYDGRVSATTSDVDEGEVSVANDPADSTHVVLSYMQNDTSGRRFPIYYSDDGGSTWTMSSFDTRSIRNIDFPDRTAEGFGDPVFAWDKNGTVYFGWIYIERLIASPASDSLYWTLNWAYSNDNGHTWQVKPAHFVGEGIMSLSHETAFNYKDGVLDREWLSVDNSGGPRQGNLYCSFTCYPPDGTGTFTGVRTKLAGADTFGPVVQAISGNSRFANVETDKNGVVHVSVADGSALKIKHTKSIDGAATFATPSIVASVPNINHYTNYVVHRRESAAVNMSLDGDAGTGDHVHIVWSDFPANTVNSYYSSSNDGGSTWSTPLSLNSLMPGKKTLMPTVAANGNNVAISFTGVDATDTANYYQVNSTDNGATFTPAIVLSSASCNYHALGAEASTSPLFFGDYNRSVHTHCSVYASWEDCRDGASSKVYFAKTNYCMLGVPEVSLVNGTRQLLDMFPNPASDIVTLKIRSAAQDITVTLADMAGHVWIKNTYCLQAGTHEKTMCINGLAKGMYVLSMNDTQGIIATRTLVVR